MTDQERKVPVHPVQNSHNASMRGRKPTAPQSVTLRAYEVYSHIHSPQPALIQGGCRGGFGVGELVAFLYAHSFPKAEWAARAKEAFDGMDL